MRADGSEFPVELIVTRPDLPGPPLFCGYLRDVTEAHARERDQRRLMDEQAALRRVATAVAASTDPRRVFGVVTEEVARLLRRAEREHGALRRRTRRRPSVGGWSERRRPQRAGRRRRCGWTATPPSARVYRTGAPARVDDYDARRRRARRASCAGSASARAVAAPIFLGGRLWGAVIVSSVEPDAVPAGRRAADRRLRRARRAGAGQRAGARGARRVARPHRRRRATPSAGGWSATCTTARSSGSCRWR